MCRFLSQRQTYLCRTKVFKTCRDRGAESANMYHGIHSFKERKQPQCVFSPFFLERQRRADIKPCLVFFRSDDRNLCREYWGLFKAQRERRRTSDRSTYFWGGESSYGRWLQLLLRRDKEAQTYKETLDTLDALTEIGAQDTGILSKAGERKTQNIRL